LAKKSKATREVEGNEWGMYISSSRRDDPLALTGCRIYGKLLSLAFIVKGVILPFVREITLFGRRWSDYG